MLRHMHLKALLFYQTNLLFHRNVTFHKTVCCDYNLFIADKVHSLEGHTFISKGAPDHNYKKDGTKKAKMVLQTNKVLQNR